jgi:Mor family transcriptional regulator
MTELIRAARLAERAAERAKIARAKRDELIVELHEQGESPKLLADAIGLSENQIFKILRARREGG